MNCGNITSTCLELALEGERLCRTGDLENGIIRFHTALSKGTDDPRCLSAVYCQLGNAYFCQQNYLNALEYHRWDLTLARLMNDTIVEAQACGNLGNTLKMLGKYEEAVVCFNRQLDIANHHENELIKSRALYNLGNVYHAKGKQWARKSGQSDPGEIPTEAADAQRKAVDYYNENLALVRQLGDRPAEGRVNGNLGNAYYLLGNFQDAIQCHQERLNFANEFGDLSAQRRAFSNLGNAFIFMADFNSAADNYRNALRLTQQLGDLALEAQACYSLGNTYTLLRDPAKAVIFHLRHLVIARRLGDRVGEGRAHWSLTNAYTALERYSFALRCARRHCLIANEIHDQIGCMTAQLMIRELRNLISSSSTENNQTDSGSVTDCGGKQQRQVPKSSSTSSDAVQTTNHHFSPSIVDKNQSIGAETDHVGVDSQDVELDAELELELASTAADVLDTVEMVTRGEDGKLSTVHLGYLDFSTIPSSTTDAKRDEMANFYSDIPAFRHNNAAHSVSETRRLGDVEDQLETLAYVNHHPSPNDSTAAPLDTVSTAATATEEEQAEDQQEFFFTLLLNSQSRRMDEQRCCLRTTSNNQMVNGTSEEVTRSFSTQALRDHAADEAMFDLIEGVQGDRMDDQRASLPAFPGLRAGPGLQLFDTGSLGNLHHATLTSRGNDNRPEELHQTPAPTASNDAPRDLDDEFLDMILRLQTVTRIEDQRSDLMVPISSNPADSCPPTTIPATVPPTSEGDAVNISVARSMCPTVPDEDFFALIQRVQSTRLDEQRCNPPPTTTANSFPADPRQSNGVVAASTSSTAPSRSATTITSTSTSSRQRKTSSSIRRRVGSWHRMSSSHSHK